MESSFTRSHWLLNKASFENIEEMIVCVGVVMEKLVESEPSTVRFNCESADRTFLVSSFDILRDEETEYCILVRYRVYYCDYAYLMETEIMGLKDATDIVHAVFHCVIDMKLCKECFALTSSDHQLCPTCIPNKIREDYIKLHRAENEDKMSSGSKVCTICMEPVCVSRLRCGHFFHRTCLIRLGRSQWYDDDARTIRCPMCRTIITAEDKYDFFMYSPPTAASS